MLNYVLQISYMNQVKIKKNKKLFFKINYQMNLNYM